MNVNIGQIGCGYWGPNLLRNFNGLHDCFVKAVAELDDKRADYINRNYPQVKVTKDYQHILDDPEIDAVVVATPARTHYGLAKAILQSNKHAFVEKPLAMTSSEVKELIAIAEEKNRIVMVGHTFEYNVAVRVLKEYISNDEIGDVYYIYSHRLNLGRVRQDVNVMWNLAPHDVSILIYILGIEPTSVSAKGASYIQEGIEDVVFMTLSFPNKIVSHVHVSWLDPNKVRRMTVVGSKKMVVYDDVSDAKIQIYDKGITKENISNSLGEYDTFGKFQLIQRAGDIILPKIDFVEPLQTECSHFVDCILSNKKPLSDGYDALRVVKVLEAAQKSLDEGGIEVAI